MRWKLGLYIVPLAQPDHSENLLLIANSLIKMFVSLMGRWFVNSVITIVITLSPEGSKLQNIFLPESSCIAFLPK